MQVTTTMPLAVIRAGMVDYMTAWEEQRRLHQGVVDGSEPDVGVSQARVRVFFGATSTTTSTPSRSA